MSNFFCADDDVDERYMDIDLDLDGSEDDIEDGQDWGGPDPDADGFEVSHEQPPKKMRFGMQLAPSDGACKRFDRSWEPIRSWRKHLYKPHSFLPGQLVCRRCGDNPEEIPF